MRILLLYEILAWVSATDYMTEKEVMDTVKDLLSENVVSPRIPYNKKKRPSIGSYPVNVTTQLYIQAINDIDQTAFSYELTMFLRYP